MAKAYKPNQAYIIDIPDAHNVMEDAVNSIKEKRVTKQSECTDLNELKQNLIKKMKRLRAKK